MAKAASAHAPAIVWFRDDLRLADQPALAAAVNSGRPVICLFLHDDGRSCGRPPGGAQRWWLHHSLAQLAASLDKIGGRLDVVVGDHDELPAIAAKLGAAEVFWTRRYNAQQIATDQNVKSALGEAGIAAHSFNGQLLREPWELATKTGGPFRVFTPFWKASLAMGDFAAPLPAPRKIAAADWPRAAPKRAKLGDLGLLPTRPDWAGGLRAAWSPGEAGAQARLAAFLKGAVARYADERDRPDKPSTSMLSPHLRFGEISVRRVLHAARHLEAQRPELGKPVAKFAAELGWREFAYHLIFHFPDFATRNYQPRFDAFPWAKNEAHLEAWRRGRTGYPIVDAGMRELWRTGFMHNRVRMVVASFLVKHLLIDWRTGEDWFWDTLCDADVANNPAGWQWVAGSGADAAPYFRVFNPFLQGEKFDPEGRLCASLRARARRYADGVHSPPVGRAEGHGARLPRPHRRTWKRPRAGAAGVFVHRSRGGLIRREASFGKHKQRIAPEQPRRKGLADHANGQTRAVRHSALDRRMQAEQLDRAWRERAVDDAIPGVNQRRTCGALAEIMEMAHGFARRDVAVAKGGRDMHIQRDMEDLVLCSRPARRQEAHVVRHVLEHVDHHEHVERAFEGEKIRRLEIDALAFGIAPRHRDGVLGNVEALPISPGSASKLAHLPQDRAGAATNLRDAREGHAVALHHAGYVPRLEGRIFLVPCRIVREIASIGIDVFGGDVHQAHLSRNAHARIPRTPCRGLIYTIGSPRRQTRGS